MRKLVTIRKVKEIQPIENADAIELAIVDGWHCVVKKNEFKVDDYCIYFEIDSFLPEKQEFEFLRKSSFKRMGKLQGFRLKTIRLRGQISQGLILPMSNLKEFTEDDIISAYEQETDLSEIFGVILYDPPIPANLAGIRKGNFPIFVPKTDLERVQNYWGKRRNMETILSDTFEVTMKMDGSSATYYFTDENGFGVCSRNLDLKESEENSFWQMAKTLSLPLKLIQNGISNIAIQGELMGPGIQGNRENFQELKLFVFNIYDIKYQKYVSPKDCRKICFLLGLTHAPLLTAKFKFDATMDVDSILKFAEGSSVNHAIREGVVFKSNENPGFSFKAISNQFLLKEKD